MERPGDVVLREVVGAVGRVPGVPATGPGQPVRKGRDEVVEGPGYDGVVVGGNVEGNDADGVANPWAGGERSHAQTKGSRPREPETAGPLTARKGVGTPPFYFQKTPRDGRK